MLAGEPFHRVEVNIAAEDIFADMRAVHAQIVEACAQPPPVPAVEAELVLSAPVAKPLEMGPPGTLAPK